MQIKLYRSPLRSPIEVAGDIVLKLHVPYSSTSTAVQVNPNIQEYADQKDGGAAQIRQIVVTTPTDETQTLLFEMNGQKKHQISIAGSTVQIELLNIGDEVQQGVSVKFFEFDVVKLK